MMKFFNLFIVFLLGFFSISCVAMTPMSKKWMSFVDKRTKTLVYYFNKTEVGSNFSFGKVRQEKKIVSGYWEKGEFKYGWEAKIRYGVPASDPKAPPGKPGLVTVDYVKNGKTTPFFKARGYVFFFVSDQKKPNTKKDPDTNKEADTNKKTSFILRHWSGAVGCAFTDFIFYENPETKPVIKHRKTQLTVYDREGIVMEAGKLCK